MRPLFKSRAHRRLQSHGKFHPFSSDIYTYFSPNKKFRDMCKYLSFTYPEEWGKLSRNSLGGPQWSVTNANLSESLRTGFFRLWPMKNKTV